MNDTLYLEFYIWHMICNLIYAYILFQEKGDKSHFSLNKIYDGTASSTVLKLEIIVLN